MEIKQKTIGKQVSLSGTGLHTGKRVVLTFQPAAENHGIKFRRIDLKEQPVIEADVDLVIDTSRGTKLGKNGVEIGTVEHVMAAIAGLDIDNLLIDLDGPECPIMDGSSMPFVKALLDAGIKEQNAEKVYFEIKSNIYFSNEEAKVEMIAMPLDGFRMTVMIDYNSPILGSQHASITNLREFKTDIAASRTFCLLNEVEELVNQNLIKGGDVNNAIVIVDKELSDEQIDRLAKIFNKDPKTLKVQKDGILNNVELHAPNEPARHKLLDLLGDMALIGVPIKAQVMAARPGHKWNIEFAKKIKKVIKSAQKADKVGLPKYDPNKKPVFSTVEIENLLPHRHPFLLVDKIIEISDRFITGIKNVTYDEYFFKGHFPKNPVMPGVLIIEALAQTGGVLVLCDKPDPENYSTYFLKIDNAKFKDKVLPGDTLILRCEMTAPIRRGVCIMKGEAYVGEKLVAEAELMAQIVKNS